MRSSKGGLLLIAAALWTLQALPSLGLPCPSVARPDLCAASPSLSLAVSEAALSPVDLLPWTPAVSVRGVEELLAQTAAGIGQPPGDRAALRELFMGLSLSFDLWQFSQSPPDQEIVLALGNIAALEARLDLLTTLVGLMLEKLGGAALSEDQEVNLVLKLEGLSLGPGTILQGRSVLTLDKDLNFYVDKITLTITSGALLSETELEPRGFSITEERLGIQFNLGLVSISSGIVIGDQRLVRETIRMSASSGDLNLVSEISFTTESQEFMIGATIGNLRLSSSSLLTPLGLGSQTFQLEWEF
ncbi:MAG: hypothetical protein NUW06_03715 [Candidatus Acetothermia bacterium]|jgi:hypothetical protein|nr:hypothetical protein [Candidatus Acetothermia bacterium]MDH7505070.1 hypothetical protein [Candidatus Acetothermia bacterium]